MSLILASASPRRRELLKKLGVPFKISVSGADESLAEGIPPVKAARRIASRKAMAVARLKPGDLVLGADTIVVLGGKILGKPGNRKEAVSMLRSLRGRTHRVITALALVRAGKTKEAHAVTRVLMRRYSDEEIDRFVSSGRAMDKAGAYAIQDKSFHPVKSYEGCFTNVVGLPLRTLAGLLRKEGININESKICPC